LEASWFRALALFLGLTLVTALFLWRLRKERELQVSQRELRALASQLIRAQEDERRRLAREIHDDLTQRLAGLGMLAGGLAQAVKQGRAENVGPRVEEFGRELERMASDAQVLARELHPSLLENLGLAAAVRSECATFGERTGLQVHFESREVPEGLEPEVSLVLYRIAQEALRNVLTHAQSRDARVTLEGRRGELILTVEDAGAGFDPAGVQGRAGMGLASMAERARLIGSDLEVDSAPGRGTRIVVRVGLGPGKSGKAPASDPS
jgi:signal transduction histidine kinase